MPAARTTLHVGGSSALAIAEIKVQKIGSLGKGENCYGPEVGVGDIYSRYDNFSAGFGGVSEGIKIW